MMLVSAFLGIVRELVPELDERAAEAAAQVPENMLRWWVANLRREEEEGEVDKESRRQAKAERSCVR